jgi:adenine-specific DNA-methyltransferase
MAKTHGSSKKSVESIQHKDASRRHIPTAEYQSVLSEDQQTPIQVAYSRRNPDLDPQLVWRGKDLLDWSDLVVQAPPIYIQEKIHPKVLVDDLRRQTEARKKGTAPQQFDFFADFNGLPEGDAKTEFYQHDANWTNRMILGDSLQVMASLAEREGMRGKVQFIYIDPPYGIKFNSNFQWSINSRDVKDGDIGNITREPEQVRAFRDTWRDGIHSYLTYLKDRITVARDLLSNTGSLFVQIGEENVHNIRILLDELFGSDNFVSQIAVKRPTMAQAIIRNNFYYVLWYAKSIEQIKSRKLYFERKQEELPGFQKKSLGFESTDKFEHRTLTVDERDPSVFRELLKKGRVYQLDNLVAIGRSDGSVFNVHFEGKTYTSQNKSWKSSEDGIKILSMANRVEARGDTLCYKNYLDDYPVVEIGNLWEDTAGPNKEVVYVVQTKDIVIRRCMLMTTDPGDLVLDPTCGSGTTAYVAEQWGRRWITIDTSRVALALARARIMGAYYPYFLLKDSRDGQLKEADLTKIIPLNNETYGNIRQGFVYERVPHIMLSSIANNTEINVIWEQYQEELEFLRASFNRAIKQSWQEWEMPSQADKSWPAEAKALHEKWWHVRLTRQKEIDASIAAKADYEYLYDKPFEDSKKVRVAGPFTVESLSPHRVLGVDENDELIDHVAEGKAGYAPGQSFEQMILENLKTAGVQQAHKEDKIHFFTLTPWPGAYIGAEGRYFEGGKENGRERRAGIFIGPEFGTVSRPDLVAAAREAGDAGFDVLVACAFNYDARSTDFGKLGAIPVLKARMNADLHMADDLKNTGKGNLFVIFGEPDIEILDAGTGQVQVKINGVDVFDPSSGEVRSDSAEGIACWFIDTDYNEESFFVRHAYFLGANDPYSALKTSLKAEINEEAWATLNSDVSRPFEKPVSGRIAVKVINHLGDEVMKVFKVRG